MLILRLKIKRKRGKSVSDKPYASELEHTNDIDGEIDDAWAEAVRNLKNKREKGGPGSGHFGHEGRPGLVGGSKPGKGTKRRITVTSPSGKKILLTPTTYPKDYPDEVIPGRKMSWNQARVHAERALRRAKNGELFDPTEHQLNTVTLWLTNHDEKIVSHINYIYWPQTRKDFLNEAMRDNVIEPYNAAAYWDTKFDKIVMGSKTQDVFDHEVGHALWRNTDISVKWKWNGLWRKDPSFDRNTNYAHTNSEEGFAETYMAFIATGGNLYKGYPDLERTYAIVNEAIENVKIY